MTTRKKFIQQSTAFLLGGILGFDRLLNAAVLTSKYQHHFTSSFQQNKPVKLKGFVDHSAESYTNSLQSILIKSENGWEISSIDFQAKSKKRLVTILHTNDFHSRFEAFEQQNKRWGNQGGIARMKDLIDRERVTDPNLFLFDSGDVFQGTPYFNIFKGHPELEWMNKAGYDATTIGNHDFDLGIEHLFNIRQQYNTPTVNCNYQFDSRWKERNLIQPFKIIQKNDVKLGVIGVGIDLKGLLSENSYSGLTYTDPIEMVQRTANFLKLEEQCDIIVVLSHLGYKYNNNKIDDLKLAARTQYIDAILGGHTHTFLPEPTLIKNKKGQNILVNQAGWAGLQLGKLVFELK